MWATLVTAPTLAAGPETTLAGVWSRTPVRARRLAREHGVPALGSFDELVERSEAIAFAVPPAVQPDLAVRAAAAERPLLLEKPLATDVDGARRIAGAVADAGVGSLVVLTYRFHPAADDFLTQANDVGPSGGRGCFLSGALLAGPFAGGWRTEEGCLLDVGPHLLDLHDAALGPVVAVRGGGDEQGWVSLLLEHATGAVSEAALCATTPIPGRTELEVYGRRGVASFDGRAGSRDDVFASLRAEFARVARTGAPHPCDAARGLHVQRIVDAARRAVATGRRTVVVTE